MLNRIRYLLLLYFYAILVGFLILRCHPVSAQMSGQEAILRPMIKNGIALHGGAGYVSPDMPEERNATWRL